MEKSLVSVIVPIYKVEKYLEKCIQSVLKQNYTNLEIILVDDGSPDSCGEICDSYSSIDSRIRVIHKNNGGLSDARNVGIDAATGEYLVFVDSDDYVHPQMISILYDGIVKNAAELSVCGIKNVEENESVFCTDEVVDKWIVLENDKEKLEYALGTETTTVFTVAWNKMYHKRLFEKERYPVGVIHEDEFTTYKMVHEAKRIAYTDTELYFYVQRANSIMSTEFNIKNLSVLDAYEERLDRYSKEEMLDWYEKILFLYRIFLYRSRKKIDENAEIDNTILDKYFKSYRRSVLNLVWILPISYKEKMGYFLSAVMPRLYYKYRFLKV